MIRKRTHKGLKQSAKQGQKRFDWTEGEEDIFTL